MVEAQRVQGVYAPYKKCSIRVPRKLVGASLGKDGQLGERTAGIKLISSVRQQKSQTTSELEESNGTVPF